MSNSTRILLDKNVVRKLLNGLAKAARNTALVEDEQIAVSSLTPEVFQDHRFFIAPATANVLAHSVHELAIVQSFTRRVEILVPGDYWRRWARRLQDVGFTREDARVLSLATFGTDTENTFLGVDELLTFDKTLIALFDEKHILIQKKLDAFRREVKPPYDDARLPKLSLPVGLKE